MTDNAPLLFWPRALGPYEQNMLCVLNHLQSLHSQADQLNLIEQQLLELPSYPNAVEAKIRYRASLLVLIDLLRQQWKPEIYQGRLYLRPPDFSTKPKTTVDIQHRKEDMRKLLSWERDAQLRKPSVLRFIRMMEKERIYEDRTISIRCLLADGPALSKNLSLIVNTSDSNEKEAGILSVIQPYLQLVENEMRCSKLKLKCIELHN
jgi:hypothetical protein